MRNLLVDVLSRMSGVFLPISPLRNTLLKDIEDSLEEMNFYGMKEDKANMKKDIEAVGKDLKISLRQAKIEFKSVQL